MTRITERTVLFADLRGSTALFEHLGNSRATALVSQTIAALARRVAAGGGTVVKTLGDGLMATFERPATAMACSMHLQEAMDADRQVPPEGSLPGAARPLHLQMALAVGEVVEMAGDVFGDAVNVAARLLDHAGDGEILITQRLFESLPADAQPRFRHLDSIVLRGRAEPVSVHVLGGRRSHDTGATAFSEAPMADDPDGIRLAWSDQERIFTPGQAVVLGRSPQAAFCVRDARVSRSHARVDWHGGGFQITDLSFNGTYVRFGDGEIVSLRRGSCTLHGHGRIGLGGSPAEPGSAVVHFEIVRFGDTQP